MQLILILIVNLLVGACVGLTGIAGFLLPMFYTGFLGMPAVQSLALSFAAFLISGIFGSFNYYKAGNLDLKTAGILSAGSFAGALLGVQVNLLIPEDIVKIILYMVVLLSGISILLRKNPQTTTREKKGNPILYLLLGLITGAICAASGAGGPILVMPLLTVIGFPVHMAVGISLFDSIFIAIPSVAGYLYHSAADSKLLLLLPVILIVHAIGVIFGSKNAVKINQNLLKRIVAIASILIACMKLLT
nr:sulfite exporter TauE/SafE family protein [uncultured Sellimonas sp.]